MFGYTAFKRSKYDGIYMAIRSADELSNFK